MQNPLRVKVFFATSCCEAILETGDGTKSNPYIVVRVSDEYDVVQYLGKQNKGQSLTTDGTRHFDMFNCEDSSEIWFDIRDAYNKMRVDGAIDDLSKAISLDPKDSIAYYNRGMAYYKKNKIKNAISDFQKACDLGSELGCEKLSSIESDDENL